MRQGNFDEVLQFITQVLREWRELLQEAENFFESPLPTVRHYLPVFKKKQKKIPNKVRFTTMPMNDQSNVSLLLEMVEDILNKKQPNLFLLEEVLDSVYYEILDLFIPVPKKFPHQKTYRLKLFKDPQQKLALEISAYQSYMSDLYQMIQVLEGHYLNVKDYAKELIDKIQNIKKSCERVKETEFFDEFKTLMDLMEAMILDLGASDLSCLKETIQCRLATFHQLFSIEEDALQLAKQQYEGNAIQLVRYTV